MDVFLEGVEAEWVDEHTGLLRRYCLCHLGRGIEPEVMRFGSLHLLYDLLVGLQHGYHVVFCQVDSLLRIILVIEHKFVSFALIHPISFIIDHC